VRSPLAAAGGGLGEGLSVSLLERLIRTHQANADDLLRRGLAPSTGHHLWPLCLDREGPFLHCEYCPCLSTDVLLAGGGFSRLCSALACVN
jgi:hypothetical protein